MVQRRLRSLLSAAVMAATSLGAISVARSADLATDARADGQVAPALADRVRLLLNSATVGLKPQSRSTDGIELPYGINYNYSYSNDARSFTFMMPMDEKSAWGIGLNLNLKVPQALEAMPPSALGLQPKRTPGLGLTVQRKF